MFDKIIDHALKNVWCTPNQDMQMVIKPARLTPYGGVWNKVKVLWRTHALPVQSARFHVYQIGQLNPRLMGLFVRFQEWISIADACNQEKLIVDVYGNSGVQMPRCECWYMVTPDSNLILAVKEQRLIPIDLNNDDIFMRVYSNAFFSSSRSDPNNDFIQVEGKTVGTIEEILTLQSHFNNASALPGLAYAFVNGYRVDAIDLITTKPGDVAEFVYDSSISEVVTFNVLGLPSFLSTLDTKHKYLLHQEHSVLFNIDYQDDLDLFVVKPGTTSGRYRGVFYHRNAEDALRMVTHKDYSIPVAYLSAYANEQFDWGDPDALQIRMHIRKSGYSRPLVDEAHRIKELYKLDNTLIVNAMVGVDAVVPEWTAAALENSDYAKIMRSEIPEVTRALVQSGLGYNALSKLLGDTPQFTYLSSNQKTIDVPFGLMAYSTAYEYDLNGELLNWHSHVYGFHYTAADPATRLIEQISGVGGTILDEEYGDVEVFLDLNASYRMYVCEKSGGIPNNEWTDVTGSSQYAIIGNKLTWLIDPNHYYTVVRSDKKFLAYSLSLPVDRGTIKFSLTHQQLRFGSLQNFVMQIPMGELDVMMNKKALIEGLDYIVQFPEIVIINKAYLINPTTDHQRIDIRFTGFCWSDFSRDVTKDTGFIKHGLLSQNNKFDIRDDKVLRITVGGQVYHRTELTFSENDTGVRVPYVHDGAPYLIRDIVVPMGGLTDENTYDLRATSQVIDKHVSDYLTLKLPEPTFNSPVSIAEYYPIYSPFCSQIIDDLKTGVLNDPRLTLQYSDQDVFDICQPYEYLLAFDPTQDELQPDLNFVNVQPHHLNTVVEVDLYGYKFLSRVVKLYLKSRVSLSHFIQISA